MAWRMTEAEVLRRRGRDWVLVIVSFGIAPSCSMGHGVKDNVNSERVGAFFGKLVEIILVLPFAFPTVAKVGVVANHDHHPAFVVEDGAVVDLAGVRPFPGDTGVLAA